MLLVQGGPAWVQRPAPSRGCPHDDGHALPQPTCGTRHSLYEKGLLSRSLRWQLKVLLERIFLVAVLEEGYVKYFSAPLRTGEDRLHCLPLQGDGPVWPDELIQDLTGPPNFHTNLRVSLCSSIQGSNVKNARLRTLLIKIPFRWQITTISLPNFERQAKENRFKKCAIVST